MHPETVGLLVDYHYWANRRLLAVVDHLPPEQFTRRLDGSFSSVKALLSHMVDVEATWLCRLRGEPEPAVRELPDAAAVREEWMKLEREIRQLVGSLDRSCLGEPVRIKTSAGREFTHPLWEPLVHLVNHGTYHRGQLASMLRQLGAQPVPTDMIYFFRERSGQM
jgi:uncharacterized damage-inducible protein DinB